MSRAPSRSLLPAALSTLAVTALVAGVLAAAGPAAAATSAAGGPGTLSHFDQARKDCVGTSRTTTSKIWFTVANGVLSDVYAPTVDTTNVESMQYLVTDGSTFTDVQQRDTTYTVSSDPTGMSCTVRAKAKSGAYAISTTYFTDPARASVMSRVTYTPLTTAARGYKLYVRLDATAGGNGGGGEGNGGADSAVVDTGSGRPVPVTYDTTTATNAANRDYAKPTYVALAADQPFGTISSGFVGTPSDGLTQLDSGHALDPVTATASKGNIEQTASVRLDTDGNATLALAVADTRVSAATTARTSSSADPAAMLQRYTDGWSQYDTVTLNPPSYHLPGLNLTDSLLAARRYFVAANVVKASEDKTFPGAIVAGLGSPWGQAVSAGDPANTYFGSYREVFSRDLYETWSALFTSGDLGTARDTVRFLFLRQQQADGSFPRNSLLNGKTAPDSFNVQPDEVAYPILMAQQSGLGTDKTLWPHVRAAADYLVAHGPSFGVERWEEQSGYSPSTIAAEIAGLVAAGAIAAQNNDPVSSRIFLATADTYQRSIKGWAVTTTGPLSTKPYFIRLSKTGDPNAAVSYNVGNGGPTLDQRGIVDAGFLELVRLGELPPTDPVLANSLAVVDKTLKRTTPNGSGWLRYNGDGYGDCVADDPLTDCTTTAAPWAPSDKGSGHIWPVLASERGEYDLLNGNAATGGVLAKAVVKQSSGVGLVPEQTWDAPPVARAPFGSDPTTASIGFVDGQPDGSTAPLTWGVSSLVRLVADLTAGEALEQPASTTARYVTHQQTATTLTVTSPADGTPGTGTISVKGTAVTGARVDVARVATDRASATAVATVTVGPTGRFQIPVTLAAGSNALVVTATAPDGGTASLVRTVFADVVDGTLLFQKADPTGDDNGPGTFQYPTAGDFHPGAYDLTNFQVYDSGDSVTFRVQTRDLTPTFGSANGAQLIDLYVTQPGVTPTSTSASYATRNHTVDPAWTQLIEAQGFGQRFVDASGTTLGSLTITANQISRYITIVAPKSAFGGKTPGAGWSFALTLTGQDGFSPDQARGFQATPQDYQFGVCATGGTSPICAVDPNTVPKVMDTITPAGVDQATELDPTRGPVVVHGFPLQ